MKKSLLIYNAESMVLGEMLCFEQLRGSTTHALKLSDRAVNKMKLLVSHWSLLILDDVAAFGYLFSVHRFIGLD